MENPIKILVAFSGGVDSTWTINMFKKQGYYVEAVHFTNGVTNTNDNITHCIKIAEKLGVKLTIIDLKTQFLQIFDHIKSELLNLRMPNPCVFCNKTIKFDYLIKYAISQGFDYFATGHYARIYELPDGKLTIMKAIDELKDQSYFLNQIDPSMLRYVKFPLGSVLKTQVYSDLRDDNIELPSGGESYDLCFTGGKKFQNFCKENFNVNIEGIITDGNNQLCCVNHSEMINLNQGVSIPHIGEKMYVVDKRLKNDDGKIKCEIVVNNKMNSNISSIHVSHINKFCENIPEKMEFVLRYHANPINGTFDEATNTINLNSPSINPGNGQYIVAYHDGSVVFGAMVE